ncbi:hypothetical protein Tco_0661917 [Tanacetum coccineum]
MVYNPDVTRSATLQPHLSLHQQSLIIVTSSGETVIVEPIKEIEAAVNKALLNALKTHLASQATTMPTPTAKPATPSGSQGKQTTMTAPAKPKAPKYVKGSDYINAYWLKPDLLKVMGKIYHEHESHKELYACLKISLTQDEREKLAEMEAETSRKRRKDDDDPSAPKDKDPKRQRKDKDSHRPRSLNLQLLLHQNHLLLPSLLESLLLLQKKPKSKKGSSESPRMNIDDLETPLTDDIPEPEKKTPGQPKTQTDSRTDWWKKCLNTKMTDLTHLNLNARTHLLRKTLDISVFYKWAAKRLGVDKITQEILEGPTFNVLKAWYGNSLELENQMEQVHLALTNQMDWTNPEGDKTKSDP